MSTLVLVHGAWHGAWCWSELQAALTRRGVSSLAVDLPGHGSSAEPLGDLHGDAQHVVDVVSELDGDVVLVGHSYGGAVISRAGALAASVVHLVYLTAFVLDAEESLIGLVSSLPPHASALTEAMEQRDDGSSVLVGRDATVNALYGRCTSEQVEAALSLLSPQPGATMVQPAGHAAWRTLPSTYVVCTDDRAVHPELQRAMASRCTTVLELDADHSPFLSAVEATADILADILTATPTAPSGPA